MNNYFAWGENYDSTKWFSVFSVSWSKKLAELIKHKEKKTIPDIYNMKNVNVYGEIDAPLFIFNYAVLFNFNVSRLWNNIFGLVTDDLALAERHVMSVYAWVCVPCCFAAFVITGWEDRRRESDRTMTEYLSIMLLVLCMHACVSVFVCVCVCVWVASHPDVSFLSWLLALRPRGGVSLCHFGERSDVAVASVVVRHRLWVWPILPAAFCASVVASFTNLFLKKTFSKGCVMETLKRRFKFYAFQEFGATAVAWELGVVPTVDSCPRDL